MMFDKKADDGSDPAPEPNVSSPNIPARKTSEKIQKTDSAVTSEEICASPENADIPSPELLSGSFTQVGAPGIETETEIRKTSVRADDRTAIADADSIKTAEQEIPDNIDEVEISAPAIAMPAEELILPDSQPSTFDSVRIMENRSGNGQEAVATRIHPGVSGGSAAELPIEVMPTALREAEIEPRPGTSPNIGYGDTDGRRSAKLKPLAEGTVLNNRYEIVRKIGGGGMGAVYLASDNNLGGVLRAVKEMVQAHIEDEQQDKAISDFKRESMILSTLDHPSIPTIYDYFYDDSECRFYLVMKYISGGDLASRLRSAPEGKIEEPMVAEWAAQIADVLDYLHNQPSPIVYRDLKPSNIMIDGNSGRVMLVDFGIARSISQREEKGVTAVGTMGYAPPELFSGNVEPRSDIYSLGSTMFHLLTGADPQSNPLLIFDFQKNPRPRQINSRLSDQIERILMRAVEYNAESRFASARELKLVLDEHVGLLKSGQVTYGVSAAPAAIGLASQSVFCGFCGQRIVATDLFCAFCGARQPIAQQGVNSEAYARAPVTAKLFVEGTGDLTMPTYSLLKDNNLLGRRDPLSNIFPEIDLSKYDPQTKISRRHARIWKDGSKFLVEDLGSSNGTVVASPARDSVRLPPHKPHVLQDGDKISLGDTTLHFVVA
ncbi:MAG: protein kinase [Pyrinomonadaceae bacterium]